MKLKDKVAIVVGGASGIAKASSKLLAQEGARVVIADLDIENAEKVADEIKSMGYEATAIKVDMTKEEEAYAMVKAVLEKYGQIDILANIAGGSVGKYIREKQTPFAESTKEEWDKILDVNLTGPRNCTRAVIHHMMERGSGRIVNFSSMAGVQGIGNVVDYSAAKAGVIAFTQGLAQEMAPYGININCIAPSGVLTERIQAFAERMWQQQREEGGRGMDTSKLARPEELAATVLFLVSDDSSHMSGQVIRFSGAGS